jgi:hypothetical protein
MLGIFAVIPRTYGSSWMSSEQVMVEAAGIEPGKKDK